MPRKRKPARAFRARERLPRELAESALHYFTGMGADLLNTAFLSDAECLRFWTRHRAELIDRWNELQATGRVPARPIPWGLALERGMSMQQWARRNSAAKGDTT